MFDLNLLKDMKELDAHQFNRLVRTYKFLDFYLVDIVPSLSSGSFLPNRANELIKFCKENQDFHIVSYIDPGIEINRYVEGASLYFLADGDKNPDLYFDSDRFLERFKSLNSGETNDLPNDSKSIDVDIPFIDLSDSNTFNAVSRLSYRMLNLFHNKKVFESSLRKNSRKDKK